MDFLEWLRPVDPPVQHCAEPIFRDHISHRCLKEAGKRGGAALILYLLIRHYGRNGGEVSLDDQACETAELSRHQRQAGLRRLTQEPSLVHVRRRSGTAPVARAIDPWDGDTPFFCGGMSFRCLVEAFHCHQGNALAVYAAACTAYVLHHRNGPVRLGTAVRALTGMKTSAWSRAIAALEDARLMDVQRRPGASPMAIPLDPWAPGSDPDARIRPAASRRSFIIPATQEEKDAKAAALKACADFEASQ